MKIKALTVAMIGLVAVASYSHSAAASGAERPSTKPTKLEDVSFSSEGVGEFAKGPSRPSRAGKGDSVAARAARVKETNGGTWHGTGIVDDDKFDTRYGAGESGEDSGSDDEPATAEGTTDGTYERIRARLDARRGEDTSEGDGSDEATETMIGRKFLVNIERLIAEYVANYSGCDMNDSAIAAIVDQLKTQFEFLYNDPETRTVAFVTAQELVRVIHSNSSITKDSTWEEYLAAFEEMLDIAAYYHARCGE